MKSWSCEGLADGCMQAFEYGILLPVAYVQAREHEVLDAPIGCMQTHEHEVVELLGCVVGGCQLPVCSS